MLKMGVKTYKRTKPDKTKQNRDSQKFQSQTEA